MNDSSAHGFTWVAVASLTLATFCWGAAFPVAAPVLQHMDPITLALCRYGIAAPLFLALLAWREGAARLSPQGHGWRLLGLGTLGFAGFNLLMFQGVNLSRPEFGAIVMALQPLIAGLIHWARSGRRPATRSFIALGVAIVGVVMLTTDGQPARLAGQVSLLPILMMITGGTCWVLYSMGAAAFPGWSPLRYTALSSTGGVLGIVIIALVFGAAGALHIPDAARFVSLLPALSFLVLPSAVIAVLCWNQGLRHVGTQSGMLFINLIPLTALAVGVARGHTLGAGELFGAALILASLAINQLERRPAAPATASRRHWTAALSRVPDQGRLRRSACTTTSPYSAGSSSAKPLL
ncbi:MAG: EamA family transporter [Candidatus Dactylopiibacterium carminicum]|uniref:EamA family transporter n=1 Tax=Candidatus Dactylopiibacterium carminicum TaxID=857335 RepID=A0A272ESH0_9RHOO|nr:EamA family transporter [Candidatus Dactylopiibacterium carminicum]KAF7600684.1 EamA/RhaT family transporter [Candidatus Dactylopiibacterium carminicum]PAS92986.1 MAG: EamA family transporter [Candidatus Dactylopiibacterium carminicum]PAT00686.1 MAG: hypothetical protein BSR46_00795 [Candidatus Dactylopiibacterium carminicum]